MQVDKNNVWVVIPAFNEVYKIGEVLRHVQDCFKSVVLVDDCSSDGTALVAKSMGVVVVKHPINLGQGAALQTGFDYAVAAGASWVVTFDADGQHDIHDAEKMLGHAVSNNLDVCFGSRFLGSTIGMPTTRKFLLKGGLLFQKLTSGAKLSDTHNGLRIIRAKVLNTIHLRQNRMAHASEIVERVVRGGFVYGEYPMTVRYSEYTLAKGQSSLGAINIIADWLLEKIFR
jgi:glycosyltransferase involved in cell wall biosynthesis